MQAWRHCLITGTVMALGAGSAVADIVPLEPGDQGCWERRYSDGHLARHPRQKITEMRFLLQNWKGDYLFDLDIATRERAGTITGRCHVVPDSPTVCTVSCGGGDMALRQSDDDGSLVLEVGASGRLRVNNRCDDIGGAPSFEIEADPDDTVFLLRPASVRSCTVRPFEPFLDNRGK